MKPDRPKAFTGLEDRKTRRVSHRAAQQTGDAAHPPAAFGWLATPGEVGPFGTNTAGVIPDFVGYHVNSPTGVLAFYYNDVPGTEQAQFIDLTATWYPHYLPIAANE